ncbi:MAG: hypothetical protein MUP76_06220 [Acidimicrobiia bacterium]|nr:hypothetical protein [Acidimicrobiia bacterium]
MTDPPASSFRPSRWWAAAGLTIAVLAAWAVGAYSTKGANLPVPTTPAATETPAIGAEGVDLIRQAEAFWLALGSGEHAAVLTALDPAAGLPLSHYAGFAATFEAGLRPEDCRPVSPNAVRCTLAAANLDLLELSRSAAGAVDAVGSATVAFSERGIESFDLPEVINTASIRLFGYAGEHGGIPAACDRLHHDAADLPPFNTVMAQTAECASALVSLIPAAVAAPGA